MMSARFRVQSQKALLLLLLLPLALLTLNLAGVEASGGGGFPWEAGATNLASSVSNTLVPAAIVVGIGLGIVLFVLQQVRLGLVSILVAGFAAAIHFGSDLFFGGFGVGGLTL